MAALVSSPHPYQTGRGAPNDDLDDDLMSLMASDTFSLESRRDRDLNLLSSLLQNALPSHPAGSHGPASSTAQWIGSSNSAGTSSMPGWNGWLPETAAPHNSYQTHPSGSYTSGGAALGFGLQAPTSTPQGTPQFSSNLPLASSPSMSNSPTGLSSSPFATTKEDWRSRSASISRRPSFQQQQHQVPRSSPALQPPANSYFFPSSTPFNSQGYRAPAASRERDYQGRPRAPSTDASLNSSVLSATGAATAAPAAGGWAGQSTTDYDEDDAMMEEGEIAE